ncbi:hypothetical protein BJX65DRAFT_74138 [Aspergillus insuetus]
MRSWPQRSFGSLERSSGHLNLACGFHLEANAELIPPTAGTTTQHTLGYVLLIVCIHFRGWFPISTTRTDSEMRSRREELLSQCGIPGMPRNLAAEPDFRMRRWLARYEIAKTCKILGQVKFEKSGGNHYRYCLVGHCSFRPHPRKRAESRFIVETIVNWQFRAPKTGQEDDGLGGWSLTDTDFTPDARSCDRRCCEPRTHCSGVRPPQTCCLGYFSDVFVIPRLKPRGTSTALAFNAVHTTNGKASRIRPWVNYAEAIPNRMIYHQTWGKGGGFRDADRLLVRRAVAPR